MTQFKIPLLIPDLPSADELLPYLKRIDENKWYTNFGPLVREYEQQLAEWLSGLSGRQAHVVTLNSGTTALELGIVALELAADAKVLIPAFTFPATGTAVLRAGLTPVLADVDEQSWLLTPAIARRVIEQTDIGLVIPVATFGVPQDVEAWDQFTVDTGIPVLIDAAAALMTQAVGKTTNCAYSLHATKPFGAGEGGLVASADEARTNMISQLSNFGFNVGGIARSGGTNGKLSEYHAAVGLAQMDRKTQLMQQYRDLYSNYRQRLAETDIEFRFQTHAKDVIPFVMCLLLPESAPASKVEQALARQDIETRRWYCPPLYEHHAFEGYLCVHCNGVGISNSKMLGRQLIGLPFHTQLKDEHVDTICLALQQILAG